MDEKTLTALKGSIKKWEDIVAGTGIDQGPDNCPLCKRFWEDDCEGCPVMEHTGYDACNMSPYDEWSSWQSEHDLRNISINELSSEVDKIKATKLAQDELDFLKSLLPKGE
jgi:hypothetical protein